MGATDIGHFVPLTGCLLTVGVVYGYLVLVSPALGLIVLAVILPFLWRQHRRTQRLGRHPLTKEAELRLGNQPVDYVWRAIRQTVKTMGATVYDSSETEHWLIAKSKWTWRVFGLRIEADMDDSHEQPSCYISDAPSNDAVLADWGACRKCLDQFIQELRKSCDIVSVTEGRADDAFVSR
jgi:hypothetical protein